MQAQKIEFPLAERILSHFTGGEKLTGLEVNYFPEKIEVREPGGRWFVITIKEVDKLV
jgi:hypothetical protein